MGLVIMFFLIPAFILLLVNLGFYFSNIHKVVTAQIYKVAVFGFTAAVVVLSFVAMSERIYLFSFIVHFVLSLAMPLIVSLVLFLKKDLPSVKWAVFINTFLYAAAITFVSMLYFTRNQGWFHY